jgi:hypothetical protein
MIRTSSIAWVAPVPLVVIALVASLASSCRSGSDGPRAPKLDEMSAGILVAAKAVAVANGECVKIADGARVKANALEDQTKRIVELTRAKSINAECERFTLDARNTLEAAERMIEGAELLAEGTAGCLVSKGLAVAESLCAVLRREGSACPRYVDSAIRFGSPLAALAVNCSP